MAAVVVVAVVVAAAAVAAAVVAVGAAALVQGVAAIPCQLTFHAINGERERGICRNHVSGGTAQLGTRPLLRPHGPVTSYPPLRCLSLAWLGWGGRCKAVLGKYTVAGTKCWRAVFPCPNRPPYQFWGSASVYYQRSAI